MEIQYTIKYYYNATKYDEKIIQSMCAKIIRSKSILVNVTPFKYGFQSLNLLNGVKFHNFVVNKASKTYFKKIL